MNIRPPALSRRILTLVTRETHRDALVHDLDAEFESLLLEGRSPREARRWYRAQVRRSIAPLLAAKLRLDGVAGLRVSLLDVRLGLRMLVKSPLLTLAAVASLTVGIPVGLAPWHAASVFDAGPPVPGGERIVTLKRFDVQASRWLPSTVRDRATWAEQLRSFSSIAAVQRTTFALDMEDDRDPTVAGAFVSASTFDALRAQPHLGRVFAPADEVPGAPDVVLLGHRIWESRYGSDPDIVGRSVRVGATPHTVVGVMPEEFEFPYREHLWLPLRHRVGDAEGQPALVFGMLAPDVARGAALAEFTAFESSEAQRAERAETLAVAPVPQLVGYTEGLFGLRPGGLRAEVGFYFVQLLALLVLLVACVNISMLLLVRTTARARELSIRAAIGASRMRIVAQLFVEAFLLALVAAGGGLLIADVAAGRLQFITEQLPPWMDLGVTWKTALGALLLAAFSAAVVGVLPAWKVTGRSIQRAIQHASAGRTGVRFGGLPSALIVADVALAVVVTGLGLVFSDVVTPRPVEGTRTVAAEEILTAEFRAPLVRGADASVAERNAMNQRRTALLTRLRAEPGVRGAVIADAFPGMNSDRGGWEVAGQPALEDDDEYPRADVVHTGPGYFQALDQPVASGRHFEESDLNRDLPVVIVDTEFAREFMGGRSPIGARIRLRGATDDGHGPWQEVVGLVDELRNTGSAVPASATVYLPTAAGDMWGPTLAIHLGPAAPEFSGRLREIARETSPDVLLTEVQLLSEAQSGDVQVFGWVFLGLQVMMGVLIALAASGTYALLAFTIKEREREIAIRAALGAPRVAILQTIGRRAALQLGGGALLGIVATTWLFTLFVADGWQPALGPIASSVLIGGCVVVLIGGLAGLGPMRAGLAIAPDVAMRAE